MLEFWKRKQKTFNLKWGMIGESELVARSRRHTRCAGQSVLL
jgi:hypothetical protein